MKALMVSLCALSCYHDERRPADTPSPAGESTTPGVGGADGGSAAPQGNPADVPAGVSPAVFHRGEMDEMQMSSMQMGAIQMTDAGVPGRADGGGGPLGRAGNNDAGMGLQPGGSGGGSGGGGGGGGGSGRPQPSQPQPVPSPGQPSPQPSQPGSPSPIPPPAGH